MEDYIGRVFNSRINIMFSVMHKDQRTGWYTIKWLNNLFIDFSDISAQELYSLICNSFEVCPIPRYL